MKLNSIYESLGVQIVHGQDVAEGFEKLISLKEEN